MDLFITITSPHLEHPSTREHIPQRWDRGHKYWTIKANDHHSISNLLSLSLSLSLSSLSTQLRQPFANPSFADPFFFLFSFSSSLSLSLHLHQPFTDPIPKLHRPKPQATNPNYKLPSLPISLCCDWFFF